MDCSEKVASNTSYVYICTSIHLTHPTTLLLFLMYSIYTSMIEKRTALKQLKRIWQVYTYVHTYMLSKCVSVKEQCTHLALV